VSNFASFHKPTPVSVPRRTSPNHHEPELSARQGFVLSFKGFAKTAKDAISQATVMVQAKKDLGEDEFKNFCADVDVKIGGSKCRKLIKIGEEAGRFEKVLDQPPDSWTILYELAKMERQNFDQLVDSGGLHPKLKRRVLTPARQKVAATPGDPTEFLPPDFENMDEFVVNLGGLPQEARVGAFDCLACLSSYYQFSLKAAGRGEELGDPS
jgi:hypothetical protein